MAQCEAEMCPLHKRCFDVYGTGSDKPPCANTAEALKPSHNSAMLKLPTLEEVRKVVVAELQVGGVSNRSVIDMVYDYMCGQLQQ